MLPKIYLIDKSYMNSINSNYSVKYTGPILQCIRLISEGFSLKSTKLTVKISI